MTRYLIRHHTEEATCERCTWPLDVGDHAYMTRDEEIACSRSCGKRLEKRQARRHS